MPTFRYQTIAAANGSAGARTIDAADRASALRALIDRGETPVRLEPIDADADALSDAPLADSPREQSMAFRRSTMSRGELTSFIRELATAINAGLSLIPALKTIARQGRTEGQRVMLNTLIESVERGTTLSDAMRAVGKPFNEMVISLVQAGEVAGRLGEVLSQAAKLLDRDVKLRRSVLSALIYPMIICVFATVAIIIVVTVIVPRVLKAVQGQAIILPWPTRVVQGVAWFFGDYWWLVMLLVAGGLYFWTRLYRRPGPRLKVDTALLRTPVLGPLLRDVAVARFTRTFGTLAGAGLPVLTSLRIVKNTLGNRALEGAIDRVCDQVSSGRTIAEPLEATGYFPPLLVQIVGLGERTGKLDEMLNQAADAFEEKTEQSVKIFTAVLPPILVVVLALVVGFIVLAVLLPLIALQGSIS